MKTLHQLRGLCAVLATPFDDAGQVDLASLERETAFYLGHGATSLMALGVMGEGPALDREEGLAVVRKVAEAAGPDVPLVVGAVGMAREDAMAFGRAAADAGASALMLTVPPETAQSLAAGADYLGGIASAAGVDLVLLDCPAIAPRLSVDAMVQLSGQIEALRAVKLEDNPTHLKIAALKARLADRLAIFGANGAVFCLHELDRGCDGFMTGYAFPEHLVEILDAHRSGDADRAADAYFRYLPLITYCWQPEIGMALRKELLALRNVISSPRVRPPHRGLDQETRAELFRVVERVTGPLADLAAA